MSLSVVRWTNDHAAAARAALGRSADLQSRHVPAGLPPPTPWRRTEVPVRESLTYTPVLGATVVVVEGEGAAMMGEGEGDAATTGEGEGEGSGDGEGTGEGTVGLVEKSVVELEGVAGAALFLGLQGKGRDGVSPLVQPQAGWASMAADWRLWRSARHCNLSVRIKAGSTRRPALLLTQSGCR